MYYKSCTYTLYIKAINVNGSQQTEKKTKRKKSMYNIAASGFSKTANTHSSKTFSPHLTWLLKNVHRNYDNQFNYGTLL